LIEIKDGNHQKNDNQRNIENSMYHNITKPKDEWQNHEYWNKTQKTSQKLKSLNFNIVDFYNDDHNKCNEIIRNRDLSDKTQDTIQNSNHELYASTIEDDQGKEKLGRSHIEEMSSFNTLEDQSRIETKKICHCI